MAVSIMPTLFADALPILLAADSPGPNMMTLLWPILMIGVLFYFMLIRPEKRKQADVQRMQQGLKKNDRVVTVGGILGVVVNVQQGSDEVTLRVDDNTNTRIRVLRSAVSRVLTAEKADKPEKSEEPAPST
jgi:preprotein translocase subunit YajC